MSCVECNELQPETNDQRGDLKHVPADGADLLRLFSPDADAVASPPSPHVGVQV